MKRLSLRAVPAAFGGILLGLLLAEAALRWGPAWIRRRLPAPEDGQFAVEASFPFFRAGRENGRTVLAQVPLVRCPPPQRVPLAQTAGTRRIVVVGESSAVPFGERLARALEEKGLGSSHQVVNAGIGGADLERVERTAFEMAGYPLDEMVVVFGHNLMYGGAKRLPAGAAPFVLPLRRVRLVQALALFLRRPAEPEDVMFDRWKSFLSRLSDRARDGGFGLTVVVLPANLWFPPLGDPSAPGRAAMREAVFLEAAGDEPAAVRALRDSAAAVPDPHVLFMLAELLYRRGAWEEAGRLLLDAKERESEHFRVKAGTNRITRGFADGRYRVLDAESLVVRESPHGIPGWDSFSDHCHLLPPVMDEVARGFLNQRTGTGRRGAAAVGDRRTPWDKPLRPAALIGMVQQAVREGKPVPLPALERALTSPRYGAKLRSATAAKLCEAFRRGRRFPEASVVCEWALRWDAGGGALLQRAWLAFARGDRGEAARFLARAAERDPGDPEVLFLSERLAGGGGEAS